MAVPFELQVLETLEQTPDSRVCAFMCCIFLADFSYFLLAFFEKQHPEPVIFDRSGSCVSGGFAAPRCEAELNSHGMQGRCAEKLTDRQPPVNLLLTLAHPIHLSFFLHPTFFHRPHSQLERVL